MKLVDVHCHLDSPRFEDDLDSVVSRFEEAGGEMIVTSGVNPEGNRKVLEIAGKYNSVRASFGLYPIDAVACKFDNLAAPKGVPSACGASVKTDKEGNDSINYKYLRKIPVFDVDKELDWIREHAEECIAIGEIGLDFKVVKDLFAPKGVPSAYGASANTDKEGNVEDIKKEQEIVFRKVLKLAKELRKVVVVHSRGAEKRVIEILEEMKMENVIMHCFNGRKALIRRCVANGWLFSVPAVIARLEHFKVLVEIVPLDLLLTETDAPYLSPVVGMRNESANVGVTLEEIAKIKGVGVEDVAEQVWENTERVFQEF